MHSKSACLDLLCIDDTRPDFSQNRNQIDKLDKEIYDLKTWWLTVIPSLPLKMPIITNLSKRDFLYVYENNVTP